MKVPKPIPLEKPKTPGGSYRLEGIALTKAEEIVAFKVNEIIAYLKEKKDGKKKPDMLDVS